MMDIIMLVVAAVSAFFIGRGVGVILYKAWHLGAKWIGRDR